MNSHNVFKILKSLDEEIQWKIYQSRDCTGNDIGTVDDLTGKECKRKCRSLDNCVAFNIVRKPEGRCWLKAKCNTAALVVSPGVRYLYVKP